MLESRTSSSVDTSLPRSPRGHRIYTGKSSMQSRPTRVVYDLFCSATVHDHFIASCTAELSVFSFCRLGPWIAATVKGPLLVPHKLEIQVALSNGGNERVAGCRSRSHTCKHASHFSIPCYSLGRASMILHDSGCGSISRTTQERCGCRYRALTDLFLRLESGSRTQDSVARQTSRRLDRWLIPARPT